MTDKSRSDHWLVRASTIRRLWWVFIVVLVLTLLSQLTYSSKGYFGVDGWLGFGAVFGFLACLVMVLVAKGLGLLLKRGEQFYSDGDDNA